MNKNIKQIQQSIVQENNITSDIKYKKNETVDTSFTNPEKFYSDKLQDDKQFRIAVSGDVLVTDLERKIIDTPQFQRLRGIRQLGLVYLIFPSANHTRFEHSIGTLAKADQIINAINKNAKRNSDEIEITNKERIIIRLYALLHDITHIPFGHTIEDELQLLIKHDENPFRIEKFLGKKSTIGELIINNLNHDIYNRFMRIYLWEENEEKRKKRCESNDWNKLKEWITADNDIKIKKDIFMHDIVSNTICADLLDYLSRDSYFCNLDSKISERFINFMYLSDVDNSNEKNSVESNESLRRLVIRLWKRRQNTPRRDILSELADLLWVRYRLAEIAYFHKTKNIVGAMLCRALQEYIYSFNLTAENLKDIDDKFHNFSDEELLKELKEKSKVYISINLSTKILNRDLYKVLKVYRHSYFDAKQDSDRQSNYQKINDELNNPETRRSIEDNLADFINVEKGSILLFCPSIDMNLKAAEMHVYWNGECKKLEYVEDRNEPIIDIISSIKNEHKKLWGVWLIVEPKIKLNNKNSNILTEAFELLYLTVHHDIESIKKAYHKIFKIDPSVFEGKKEKSLDSLEKDFNIALNEATNENRDKKNILKFTREKMLKLAKKHNSNKLDANEV